MCMHTHTHSIFPLTYTPIWTIFPHTQSIPIPHVNSIYTHTHAPTQTHTHTHTQTQTHTYTHTHAHPQTHTHTHTQTQTQTHTDTHTHTDTDTHSEVITGVHFHHFEHRCVYSRPYVGPWNRTLRGSGIASVRVMERASGHVCSGIASVRVMERVAM